MSWHLVDGVPLPDPVGGHPALDFCNTRAGWSSATPKEYLTSPRALALWAVDAGLTPRRAAAADLTPDPDLGPDPDPDPDPAEGVSLQRALDLREALYACLLGLAGGPGAGPGARTGTGAEWELVGREVVAARAVSTLRPTGSGHDGRQARWELDAASLPPARAALHAAAGSAELLLTSTLAGCVAACPGAGCGWLFADPRRRRRWCSMAVCGNRAKARRHAARRTTDDVPATVPHEGGHGRYFAR